MNQRGTSKSAYRSDVRGKLTLVQVIPWLLEREYQQHRNLDYYGLPETFAAWRESASAFAYQLSRVTHGRVVKMIIHPRELEEWARRTEQAVCAQLRSQLAETLWRAERSELIADRDFRVRVGSA